ncbi:hypothetical protein CH063_05480 [Colletotrichum higginsianum]|uniref:Cell wall protein n=2 Tax=Colletotrichum higginsianum TaxID=80884 RepID=H1UZ50_COLHI|nr:hypothetical protein CH63R_03369 [Colletotrichum higginsianum IMI 349063]OBR14643.1 hypothetical protein CH63R_03369 [Colletotrichum higginsianum IMI 349063]TID02484.1 hypothetical protein CH35J_004738 [Colletotrichum higginsianum]GJD05361.1 hypothetical protein ColKHC_14186 [Colletotrichum higginsianum]CCF33251.1 hypothetical protein CH063_05480 [Colletotrichum higginsianum]
MRSSILFLFLAALFVALVAAQTPTPTDAPEATTPAEQQSSPPSSPEASGTPTTPTSTAAQGTTSLPGGGGGGDDNGGGTTTNPSSTAPPDVHLKVPELSVGRIELDVDNLSAEVNLAAEIAKLVTINAGVQVAVEKVNITIVDVRAELELVIRLGHLVDIVNRTLASLDLNPLLINLLDTVGDVVDDVVGAVDGLLGSIVNGDTKINFLIDNLGNIVQEVANAGTTALSTIIGNYQQNMTLTGSQKDLGNGLVQKTYEYAPLSALVNIVFNTLGQVVRATVVKGGGSGSGSSTASGTAATTAAPTTTAAASA